MSDGDQNQHATSSESEIGKLAASVDLSRRVALLAMAVLVAVGFALGAVVVGSLGFDPVAIISVAAAIAIGLAFLAWHRHSMRLYANLLKALDRPKASPAGEQDPPRPSDDDR